MNRRGLQRLMGDGMELRCSDEVRLMEQLLTEPTRTREGLLEADPPGSTENFVPRGARKKTA
jgi:hypothetical protein